MPVPGSPGRTISGIASAGLPCHVSPNMASQRIPSRHLYFLLDSAVGPDVIRYNDLLENLP
jgi:hypothetical protein